MATDRMYLVCDCGSEFAIARYLAPPWYAYENQSELLTAWFEEHQYCQPGVHYPAQPRLVYGSDGPPSPQVEHYMAKVRAGEIALGAALADDDRVVGG